MSTRKHNSSDASASSSSSSSTRQPKAEKKHRSAKKASAKQNQKRPFRDGCHFDKAFVLCIRKGGIRKSEFKKIVKASGGTPDFIAKIFARNKRHSSGWTWKFSRENDRYVIEHVRFHGKKVA